MSSTGPPVEPVPRPRQPGAEVWRLRHPDGRALRCVLPDDTVVAAGVEVQLFDGAGELIYAKRCADRAGALYVGNAWKEDNVRGGWGA
jgi:hypothetical protein